MLPLRPVSRARSSKRNRPRSFCGTCPASDDDDDAVMRLPLRQLDEVVAVTCHQEATVFVSELQDCRIGGLLREDISQAQDFVTEFLE